MSGKLKVLFTWTPPRGLERIAAAAGGSVIATADRHEMLDRIRDAHVACVGAWDAELFNAARELRWVQAFSGGVEGVLFPEFVASPVPLTCLKGTFNVPAAEYALGVMLAFSRKIAADIRERPTRRFTPDESFELAGKTVGIVGCGGMGAEITLRCKAFRMAVVALGRTPRPALPGVDRWLATDQMSQLLAASDFVVVAVPLTPDTRGLIGAPELAAMKRDAYLIDVSGRPAVYDLAALADALRSKRIAGASLQMVPPDDSPLWAIENLLLSYHRIGSREHFDRCIELFSNNLRRFKAGQPLLGVVDKHAGY